MPPLFGLIMWRNYHPNFGHEILFEQVIVFNFLWVSIIWFKLYGPLHYFTRRCPSFSIMKSLSSVRECWGRKSWIWSNFWKSILVLPQGFECWTQCFLLDFKLEGLHHCCWSSDRRWCARQNPPQIHSNPTLRLDFIHCCSTA